MEHRLAAEEVRKHARALDDAIERRDIEGIASCFSDDCEVQLPGITLGGKGGLRKAVGFLPEMLRLVHGHGAALAKRPLRLCCVHIPYLPTSPLVIDLRSIRQSASFQRVSLPAGFHYTTCQRQCPDGEVLRPPPAHACGRRLVPSAGAWGESPVYEASALALRAASQFAWSFGTLERNMK